MALGISHHTDVGSGETGASAGLARQQELQRHVARELHDQVAQPLIALLLEIREAKAASDRPERRAADFAQLEESARKILRQVREMMVDLRDKGDLRFNLPRALKDEVPVPAGGTMSLHVTSRWPEELNGWAAFNLLRIVQQAAANAWRHGHAKKIDVVLDVGPSTEAVVVIIDDGIGIEDAPRGFGMAGMEERAAILGGTLTAAQLKVGGTRVEVRFPAGLLV